MYRAQIIPGAATNDDENGPNTLKTVVAIPAINIRVFKMDIFILYYIYDGNLICIFCYMMQEDGKNIFETLCYPHP